MISYLFDNIFFQWPQKCLGTIRIWTRNELASRSWILNSGLQIHNTDKNLWLYCTRTSCRCIHLCSSYLEFHLKKAFCLQYNENNLKWTLDIKKSTSYTILKGLSHEIDFKNVDENGQILALIRAAAEF